MSGNEVAALIVAVTTALGAIFAGVRNLRSDKIKADVEAAAAVLSGYTNLAQSLQTEVERVKAEHAEDRKSWHQEKLDMRAEHALEVKDLRDEHRAELQIAYDRIDELGTQVFALQNRPLGTRDRSTD